MQTYLLPCYSLFFYRDFPLMSIRNQVKPVNRTSVIRRVIGVVASLVINENPWG